MKPGPGSIVNDDSSSSSKREKDRVLKSKVRVRLSSSLSYVSADANPSFQVVFWEQTIEFFVIACRK